MTTDIKMLSRSALLEWLAHHKIRSFRADQILKWLYLRHVRDFSEMTDLRKDFRQLLSRHFRISTMPVNKTETAADGTRKFLFDLEDHNTVESVLIPEKDHHTLCVSSQVGCALGCQFCVTGQGGLVRNLTFSEIVGQIIEVRRRMENPEQLTNLVFMGMGEPLANYNQLIAALEIVTDCQWGMKFGARRITVSTAGVVPRIAALGRDTRVNLAISLNAVDDAQRSQLMPINRVHPIADLLAACRQFPLPKGRKVTVEYILFKGINDSDTHARKLARLLAPVKAKVNLIPFNAYPGSAFQRPSGQRIQAFQSILLNKYYTCVVRYSKGLDIMAACGQLSASSARA